MKFFAFSLVAAMAAAGPALAYDGTNCRAPGNCWEPKPGYPEQIEGTQYDPQHDPAELSKQGESLTAMDLRNEWRVWNMTNTGKFEYDVTKIDGYEEGATPPTN